MRPTLRFPAAGWRQVAAQRGALRSEGGTLRDGRRPLGVRTAGTCPGPGWLTAHSSAPHPSVRDVPRAQRGPTACRASMDLTGHGLVRTGGRGEAAALLLTQVPPLKMKTVESTGGAELCQL